MLFSNGFIEHFEATSDAIRSLSRHLCPGGIMITLIPNMAGLTGSMQKLLDKRIYDTHVPLDAEGLADAHRQAGLDVLDSRYLMTLGFNILKPTGLDRRSVITTINRTLVFCLAALSVMVWASERLLRWRCPSRTFSPYIAVIARLPAETDLK